MHELCIIYGGVLPFQTISGGSLQSKHFRISFQRGTNALFDYLSILIRAAFHDQMKNSGNALKAETLKADDAADAIDFKDEKSDQPKKTKKKQKTVKFD